MFDTLAGVTSQGSPLSVLRRAIRGGSLGGIEMALIDVPAVDLQDALEIMLLMAEAEDPRFERWAERWIQRAASEDARRLNELLGRVPEERAVAELRARAKELRDREASAGLRTSAPREDAGPA